MKEVNMPGGDRTGPNGLGPMTGRQMGYCVGNLPSGNMYGGYGRGFFRGSGFGRGYGRGFGRGFGFGFRNVYPTNISSASEKTIIENDIRMLKEQLSSLEEQLSRLDKES
jgi:hypothetical protein